MLRKPATDQSFKAYYRPFHKCPIDYLRRELADFLKFGIGHDSKYPNGFPPWQAFMVYNHVPYLVEAAYRLYTDQQTQRVLNTSQ